MEASQKLADKAASQVNVTHQNGFHVSGRIPVGQFEDFHRSDPEHHGALKPGSDHFD